jgi:hypothetical protein
MSNYQDNFKEIKDIYQMALVKHLAAVLAVDENSLIANYNIEANTADIFLVQVNQNSTMHCGFTYNGNNNMQISSIAYETVESGAGVIARPVMTDLQILNHVCDTIKTTLLTDIDSLKEELNWEEKPDESDKSAV